MALSQEELQALRAELAKIENRSQPRQQGYQPIARKKEDERSLLQKATGVAKDIYKGEFDLDRVKGAAKNKMIEMLMRGEKPGVSSAFKAGTELAGEEISRSIDAVPGLRTAKEAVVDPLGRGVIRPFAETYRGIQAMRPGGAEGYEPVQTPFGELKPRTLKGQFGYDTEAEKEAEKLRGQALWQSAGETAEIALTALPVEKIFAKPVKYVFGKSKEFMPGAYKTAKELGEKAVGKFGLKAEKETAERIIGKITQSTDPYEKKQLARALDQIDPMDISPTGEIKFGDLVDYSKNVIKKTDESLQKTLSGYTKKYKLDDLSTGYKAGKTEYKENFLKKGIDELSDFYSKTGNLAKYAELKEATKRFTKNGIDISEINAIAREFGKEIASLKSWATTGKPKSGITAQGMRNIYSEIKNISRSRMKDDTAKLLDQKMSDFIKLRDLSDKNSIAVNKLMNKIEDRGLVSKIFNKVGHTINYVTGNAPREFFKTLFMQSNIGNKTLNSLDLEKNLAKNLQKYKELSNMIEKQPKKAENVIMQRVKEFIKTNNKKEKETVSEIIKKNKERSKKVSKKIEEPKKVKIKKPKPTQSEAEEGKFGQVFKKAGTAKKSAKTTTGKAEDSLIKEAKKYKSADEFIGTQKKLYHGTSANNVFSNFDIKKAGKGVGSNIFDQGDQIYLTKSKSAADFFSKLAEDNKALRSGGFPSGERGTVLDFYLSKTSKVKVIDDMPRGGKTQDVKKIIDQAKKEGYDAISFKDKGFNTIEGSKEVFDIIKKEGLPETTIVLNTSKLKTKQQLKDIYNKATQ